jgi:cysteine desulfurase/selenocysteine lyase
MTNTAQITEIKNQDIREQFPILNREINGHPLVYLDNAASSQKPKCVIDAISNYYSADHSNVHRGVHTLSQIATDKFEAARKEMQHFLNAKSDTEIIFTSGCTDGINLVAGALSHGMIAKGDEILISEMEHHSNIVPWQLNAEYSGAKLVVTNVLADGSLDMDDFRSKLSDRTKLVSIVHVSNALGTINPVKEITKLAKEKGAWVFIDGAQAAPHTPIDVQDIGCDFYVLSGHKMYGPTGSGILYGKADVLNAMPPYRGGGEMIATVTFEKTTYNEIPFKFEAGTPNIADAIGLAEAAKFIGRIGYDRINEIEHTLLEYATEKLHEIDGVRVIGEAENKSGVLSFVIDGIHPSDVGTIIDKLGIAVRTGHHCTQPLMAKFGLPGTIRASFAIYNTLEEIDKFIAAVKRAVNMLQ